MKVYWICYICYIWIWKIWLPLYVEKSHKSFFYYAIYNIYSRYYLCIWLSSNTTFYVHILSSKYIPLKILTVYTIMFIFTFRCYHKSFINISKNIFQKSFTSSMNLWFMKSIRLRIIIKKKYTYMPIFSFYFLVNWKE